MRHVGAGPPLVAWRSSEGQRTRASDPQATRRLTGRVVNAQEGGAGRISDGAGERNDVRHTGGRQRHVSRVPTGSLTLTVRRVGYTAATRACVCDG